MDSIAELIQQLFNGNDEQADHAARQLSAHPLEAWQALRSWLSSPDEETRWWCVRALAELPSQLTITQLLQALGDDEPSVRQCAALALQNACAEEAIPALVNSLGDPDSLVARLAGNALVATGKVATQSLIDALQTGNTSTRAGAARALALSADPEAICALYFALQDDSALVRYWADEGLDRLDSGMVYFSL